MPEQNSTPRQKEWLRKRGYMKHGYVKHGYVKHGDVKRGYTEREAGLDIQTTRQHVEQMGTPSRRKVCPMRKYARRAWGFEANTS